MKAIIQGIREQLLMMIIICVIGGVTLAINCYSVVGNSSIEYPIEIFEYGCVILDFFFVLLVTVPFVGGLYLKRKNRFIEYAAVRINKKKYITSQTIAGMIVTGLSTFIIYFSGLLLSIFVFVKDVEFMDVGSSLDSAIFGMAQINNPIMFGFFWCVWKGVVMSIITRFGYKLALYLDNIFVIMVIPFLYVMADNLITGLLQIPEYSVMTTYMLNRLSPECMTVGNYVYGIISFIVITTAILKVLEKRKGINNDMVRD